MNKNISMNENVFVSKNRLSYGFVVGLVLLFCSSVFAQTTNPIPTNSTLPDPNLAESPMPRLQDYSWMSIKQWDRLHLEDVAIALQGEVDLLFIGDSITQGWPQVIWDKYFAKYRAANFGIGGDKTQNLLWRLNNGAVSRLSPKVVNLLIGVNNFNFDNASPEQVNAGIRKTVARLKVAYPNAHIVLNSILPYGEAPTMPGRALVQQTNKLIADLDADERVTVVNFAPLFLQPDKSISRTVMFDYLHPTKQGYEIYASALSPIIDKLMLQSDAK